MIKFFVFSMSKFWVSSGGVRWVEGLYGNEKCVANLFFVLEFEVEVGGALGFGVDE